MSSEKQGNQISESGMVNGYHLHKAADKQCLPDGNNRLVLKKCLELARVQQNGCTVGTQTCFGKQSKNTAALQSSIQPREASLHLMCSLKFLSITASRSVWTEKTELWTTSELSVFGEASSTRTSTLNAMRQ